MANHGAAGEPGQSVRPVTRGWAVTRGVGLLSLRVASVAMAYATTVVLARLMGAGEYGAYSAAVGWLLCVLVPALSGWELLMVREISARRGSPAWLETGVLRRIAYGHVILTSLLLLAICALVLRYWDDATGDRRVVSAFAVCIVALPLAAINRVRQGILEGLRLPVLAQMSELLIQPAALLGVALLAWRVLERPLTADSVAWMHVAGVVLTFLISGLLLRGRLPRSVGLRGARQAVSVWRRSGPFLTLFLGIQILNLQVNVLLLAWLGTPEQAGIYAVASRMAQAILMVLVVLNTLLAPVIAELYAAGRLRELQETISRMTGVASAVACPVALVLMLYSGDVLRIFCGEEYVVGSRTLGILCLTQLVNILMGPVGIIFLMTGNERLALTGVSLGVVTNVVIGLLSIPGMGHEGAAMAALGGAAVWNVCANWWLYRKTKLVGLIRIPKSMAGVAGDVAD